ncbi:hypothetical protein O181_062136 [Austropuccinia psidii MF-1]|uniref:Reverse transcriptase Ty1/copia-type domain-containing protein n=1 Tax=Austropuccinia psidii MF-1 TaxID=1389203 RepID=A0A9Q3EHG3_9BASI|nr:hypothetical protein [Austropuccinia psidii MF-1]
MLTDTVPYTQAITSMSEKTKWKEAMDNEFNSLMNHSTGELVPYPKNNEKVIGGMWCLTRKRNEFGEVYCYKAQWEVFGNHQEHLLHYFDTWASVGRNETFKTMLSLVININLIAYQFDIETAFLHGDMDTIVYFKQVKGYEQVGKENWVWRLKRSLYGTKQAPRMWKEKLTKVLADLDLFSLKSDKSLFITRDYSLMLHIHVDNAKSKFGIYFNMEKNEILINQSDLIYKLLNEHDMIYCKAVKTSCNGNFLQEIDDNSETINLTEYQQAIGSLNYLAQHSRPDIMFTVNQLSRFSTSPATKQWKALKHLLRYLKGKLIFNLSYKKSQSSLSISILMGWADTDDANAREDRKSISGYVVQVYENPVCWLNKRQSVVAQSTTESE